MRDKTVTSTRADAWASVSAGAAVCGGSLLAAGADGPSGASNASAGAAGEGGARRYPSMTVGDSLAAASVATSVEASDDASGSGELTQDETRAARLMHKTVARKRRDESIKLG